MHHLLLQYFNNIMPLTPQEADDIAATILEQQYPRGHILLREGQVSYEAWFVLDGCVRQYVLVDGEERTTQFYLPGHWVTSVQSFRDRTPSRHFIACSTDATLVVGNRGKEEALYQANPKFETISRIIMERIFAQNQEQLSGYMTDTPEQRYQKLVAQNPHLLQMVPQYQIASYIGVRPESLSRIRRRLASGNAAAK